MPINLIRFSCRTHRNDQSFWKVRYFIIICCCRSISRKRITVSVCITELSVIQVVKMRDCCKSMAWAASCFLPVHSIFVDASNTVSDSIILLRLWNLQVIENEIQRQCKIARSSWNIKNRLDSWLPRVDLLLIVVSFSNSYSLLLGGVIQRSHFLWNLAVFLYRLTP